MWVFYLLLFSIIAQLGSCDDRKIHDDILRDISSHPDVFVRFESLDVRTVQRNARNLSSNGARGAFVYETMTSHAKETQASVLELLEGHPSSFGSLRSYWIVNAIRINQASETLIHHLSETEGVILVDTVPVFERAAPIEGRSLSANNMREVSIDSPVWGVDKIGAPDVWNLGFRGAGVTVGVIDTGVRLTHEAITSRYRGNNGDGTFDHDYNYYAGTASTDDTNGHGTHVTGTICGENGIGVAPEAQFIVAYDGDQLAACEWMLCPTRADGTDPDCSKAPSIISGSWHSPQTNADDLISVISAWQAAGQIPVFAIGNEGRGCSTANAPGDFVDVIGVGNVGQSSDGTNTVNLVSSSSRGPPNLHFAKADVKPDVVAPGEDTYSAWIGSDSAYETQTGTSMSTPAVSGLLALMINAAKEQYGYDLSYETAYDVLVGACTTADVVIPTDDYFPCGGVPVDTHPNNYVGYGLVNAPASINSLPSTQTTTPPVDDGTGLDPAGGSDTLYFYFQSYAYLAEMSFTVSYNDDAGNHLVFQSSSSTASHTNVVIANGVYNLDLYDSYGDGWNGGYLMIFGGTVSCSSVNLLDGFHGVATLAVGGQPSTSCSDVTIEEVPEVSATSLVTECNNGLRPICQMAPWLTGSRQAAEPDAKVHESLRTWDSERMNIFVHVTRHAEHTRQGTLTRSMPYSTRGNHVYQSLKTHAETTQKDILSWLEAIPTDMYAKVSSTWIVNGIFISDAHRSILDHLTQFPEVISVTKAPKVMFDDVVSSTSRDGESPMSSEAAGSSRINYDDATAQYKSTGITDTWESGVFGDGVVIGIMASGVRYTHEALRNTYRGSNRNGMYDHDYNYMVFSVDDEIADHVGTGTMATSIAAGEGGYGVAPNARWIAAQFSPYYYEWDPAAVVEAAQWMLCPTKADGTAEDCSKAPHIVLNPWYFLDSDEATFVEQMADVVTAWENAGMISVFDMGSRSSISGTTCGVVSDVAGLTNVFSAGSYSLSNSKPQLRSDSRKGPFTSSAGTDIIKPDVATPGYYVSSAYYDSDSSYITNLENHAATSVAAGILALVQSVAIRDGSGPLTFSQMWDTITTTAGLPNPVREPYGYDSSSPCGGIAFDTFPNNYYGYGPMDVVGAIEALGGATAADNDVAYPLCGALDAVPYCQAGYEPACEDASAASACFDCAATGGTVVGGVCETVAACAACHEMATCIDATCVCISGFEGDGETCTDIDECAAGSHECDPVATCENIDGDYNCICPDGYVLNGRDCVDSDECAMQTDTCHMNALCTNTDGGYTCACNDGYLGDGFSCSADLQDECADGTHTCHSLATCVDTEDSFECTCNTGYEGSGHSCADLDECTASASTCVSPAYCLNTAGSFVCGCPSGYDPASSTTCEELDECVDMTHNCDSNAACSNTEGSFACACNGGFTGDGVVCGAADECSDGTHTCHALATCTDTVDGFECTCNDGYDGDGTSCNDVNECSTGAHDCPSTATCTNTMGSFDCVCETGYVTDADGGCTDIDECVTGTATCDHQHGQCENTAGSFSCSCTVGFEGDGIVCTEQDECSSGAHNCHRMAVCTDTDGSFTCECASAFTGDGVECESDVWEEVPHGLCVEGIGCFCEAGFTYTSNACRQVEIIECSEDNCPDEYNPSQLDADGDGIGDGCAVTVTEAS